jgi:hypothetical protein
MSFIMTFSYIHANLHSFKSGIADLFCWGASILISVEAILIYIPTNGVSRSLNCILTIICYLFSWWFPSWWVRWNLSVVLIFISLMAKDVTHFSCVYWPFVFLFRTVHLIWPLIDLIIWFCGGYSLSSLYTLDINPLSDE